MLDRLSKLTKRQKQILMTQAAETLADWGETGKPELVSDEYEDVCNLNNADESVLALWKCECGHLQAELEELGELVYCGKCGKNGLDLED